MRHNDTSSTNSPYIYSETDHHENKRWAQTTFNQELSATKHSNVLINIEVKRKKRNLMFLFFEAQLVYTTNFLIQFKCYTISVIIEWEFGTWSKRNLASEIKFSKYNANFAFLQLKNEKEKAIR